MNPSYKTSKPKLYKLKSIQQYIRCGAWKQVVAITPEYKIINY